MENERVHETNVKNCKTASYHIELHRIFNTVYSTYSTICICKNVSSLKHIGASVSRGISDSYKRTDAHPNPVPYMLPSKMLMVQPCKQIFHRNHD